MRSIKSVIVVVLLAICIENILCKNVDDKLKPDNLLKESNALATRERDLRDLRDVWDQVKQRAISSLNFLKKVAEDTGNRITKWASSAKDYAEQIEKSFAEQLQDLQKRMTDIITDLLGTGKVVQECLKIEEKNIQYALKELLQNMSLCVSNQIKQLTQIKGRSAQLNINDTHFMTDLDNKLDACESEKGYEKCLYTVRGLMYDNIKELDEDIQKTNLESRSIADNTKNTLIACSLQNLGDASTYISSEIMDVVKCVMDSTGVNEAIKT